MSASPSASTQALRQALGRFTTGVTIVTCIDGAGAPAGLTANSFNALSLDPPLVLWSLRRASPSLASFMAAPRFAINVLAEAQVDLSRRFASPLPDKFSQGGWAPGESGVPVLAGCVAVFECERVSHQDAGDHVLFVGRVLHMSNAALAPLVFHAGRYHLLGEIL
jgi:flavin reductase (DIM6/NTAB) family NADH-FMN oxidoreductase RutF